METQTTDENMTRYPAEALRVLARRAAEACGTPPDEADVLADTLVVADVRGVASHGLVRLPIYLRRVREGGYRLPTVVRFADEDAAVCHLDGGGGLGQVVAVRAMESAIGRARRHGIGAIAVSNSNHLGAAAYYAIMALGHDMIGVAITNTPPAMAPWGGIDRKLGNNPIAVAVPAGKTWPVVLDMAQTVVARGWIKIAAGRGLPIPLGWALDSAGQPTTDAEAALNGLLLPIGGYKGYGLAVIVEILAGVLSGAGIATELVDLGFSLSAERAADEATAEIFRRSQNIGHFVAAIDIRRFQPIEVFKSRMDWLATEIKSSRLASSVAEILLPGEREYRCQEERLRDGVPLPGDVLASLQAMAQELGLQFPEPVAGSPG